MTPPPSFIHQFIKCTQLNVVYDLARSNNWYTIFNITFIYSNMNINIYDPPIPSSIHQIKIISLKCKTVDSIICHSLNLPLYCVISSESE